MSFDKAKLLAYALGELDKNEAKAVEEFLQTNEDAARFVHENQLFASTVQADLSKEKVPLGQGIAGLERAAERSKGKKSPGAQSRIGWMEASVGIMIVLAVILYWRKPLVGMWQTPQQADSNLDFYQPTHSSLSGNSANGPGKTLSALQVTEALAEWNNRPKVEEIFGDCTFFVPAPEANLTKTSGDQKAWFYLLNGGQTQVRLIMDASLCTLSLGIQANLPPEGEAEVDGVLLGFESEMNALVRKEE